MDSNWLEEPLVITKEMDYVCSESAETLNVVETTIPMASKCVVKTYHDAFPWITSDIQNNKRIHYLNFICYPDFFESFRNERALKSTDLLLKRSVDKMLAAIFKKTNTEFEPVTFLDDEKRARFIDYIWDFCYYSRGEGQLFENFVKTKEPCIFDVENAYHIIIKLRFR